MEPPAFLDQPIAQFPGPLPARFVRAGIEPDFQRQLALVERVHHLVDNAFVPPDRGRHHGEPGEDMRKPKPERQRGQSAERGSAKPGEFRFASRAVFPVDERLQFLDQKPSVSGAASPGCGVCAARSSR